MSPRLPTTRAACAGAAAILLAAACARQNRLTVVDSRGSMLADLVHARYSQAADSTRVRTEDIPVAPELSLYAAYKYPGQHAASPPESVAVVFEAQGVKAAWRDPQGRALTLVLDDTARVTWPETQYRALAYNKVGPLTFGGFTEWVWVNVPRDVYERLASARRIDGRLARVSFTLGQREMAPLRVLAQRMTAEGLAGR